jgi:hypothetical protein
VRLREAMISRGFSGVKLFTIQHSPHYRTLGLDNLAMP